jgi:hypothetical protein
MPDVRFSQRQTGHRRVESRWRFLFLRAGALLLFVTIGISHDLEAQITLVGGNQILTVTTGSPGSEPLPVVNTATSMRISRQGVITKVTVSTICPGQKFTLKALATAPTKGIAAPEVTLINGMPDTNFITDIPSGGAAFGRATIQYTASSTFSQGNSTELGDDIHTVIYTHLAQ